MMPIKFDDVYAMPTTPVTKGSLTVDTHFRQGEPMLSVSTLGGLLRFDVTTQPGSTFTAGSSGLRAVYAGKGSAADFAKVNASGKIAVMTRSDDVAPDERVANAIADGATMVVVVNDPLFVEVNLPSRMTLGIKVGETMQVRYLDEPNKWREAKVLFFDPVADASVGRQMVRLEMPNAEQRRAGQEIAVKLPANLAAAK